MRKATQLLAGGAALTLVAACGWAQTSDELFPPNAEPGRCYARVFVPPAYENKTESKLKHAEYEKLTVAPATFEMAEERVLVKEASERLEVIPATYEWVEERMLVKAASSKVVTVPAEFETETERVVDKPAHTVWKKGRGPIEKLANGTGEIMCLVEVPATYKTVTRRVVKTPPTTRKVDIPAEHQIVKRQVLKTPAATRTIKIPAEYRTVKVMQVASEPRIERMRVPAEYQTVSRTELIAEGRMEWQQVLCETNMSKDVVANMQRNLKDRSYYTGPIDGVFGNMTVTALRSFQRAEGIPEGRLTLDALQKLGVGVAND